MKEYLENRIKELYKADAQFFKDSCDISKMPMERSIARQFSNEVTFARQELQAALKHLEKIESKNS